MSAKQDKLHIFIFPFMAPGHMLPAMDMARIFAAQGLESTVITTPGNTTFFTETTEVETRKPDMKINLLTIKFPSEEAGLPQGIESADSISSPEMFIKFFKSLDYLQQPLENLIEKFKPNCVIADYFIHWVNSTCNKFGIPCLTFHGMSYFSQCISYNLLRHELHKKVSSDSETFVVPGDLPDEVKLTKTELTPYDKNEGPSFFLELMVKIRAAMRDCYGVIMNSFYELECDYADYYEKIMGMKHWHIGPFSLYFNGGENRGNRGGKKSSIDDNECRRWLDEKEVDSVIYICLGSMSNTSNGQLHEIAIALEDLGQNFILVVRNEDTEEWVPHGFKERIEGRGLIIRGWAPQPMILHHRSVGGLVTHCGWNSILEGVTAGVNMVTWPMHAEQFYNEKLVTDVLKIGVKVGSKKWVPRVGNHDILINNKEILKAMTKVLIGKEAQDMRKRAKECKEMAKKAISEGGSSCTDLDALIGELRTFKN